VQITATAVSLNVADVPASAAFLTSHFGFRQEMAADGFASLAREDAGMNVVFLRRGLPLLPEDQRDTHAAGLILAFVVEDLEGELARLRAEGVDITMPRGALGRALVPGHRPQRGHRPAPRLEHAGRPVTERPGRRTSGRPHPQARTRARQERAALSSRTVHGGTL
jgi:catechol 2,3-dioxygenase-like lactoylglutathione lyase family enzyme